MVYEGLRPGGADKTGRLMATFDLRRLLMFAESILEVVFENQPIYARNKMRGRSWGRMESEHGDS